MITSRICGFYRPQNNKPHYHITHMRILQTTEQQASLSHCTHANSTDHRTTVHIITLHTCGFYRPQNNNPHDHIAHMRIIQTTEQQNIRSHYTQLVSTDHRTTNHMITLHTCGFYRPQNNKPYDHITHMRILQTTEPQAI